MSGSIPNPSCADHPDRAAAAHCAHCGKAVCEACSTEFVATEQTFCSDDCRDAFPREKGLGPVSNAVLVNGLRKPIRIGWGLWIRSIGRIATQGFPVAVAVGLLVGFMNGPLMSPMEPTTQLVLTLMILVCATWGVALVGVVLSSRHAGLVEKAPLAVTARRYVPWVLTWVLMVGITLAGYVALIVPGVYLSLRLFWADEFALVHGKGPFAAIKASWDLTRNQVGALFVFQFILGLAQYLFFIPLVVVLILVFTGLAALGLDDSRSFSGAQAFVLVLVGLVFYGSIHGPEIVQFYGMRAARSNADAGMALTTVRQPGRLLVAVTAVLVATSLLGIIAAITIPNLVRAVDRAKQKVTLVDLRSLASAMEAYGVDNDRYPSAANVEELESLLVPDYLMDMPNVDGWGQEFKVVSTSTGYEIRSAGKDQVFEVDSPRGPITDFDADLVFRDGEFVQWPLGVW